MASSRVADRDPALDGIRAFAVGAVLLFHGGFTWAAGGFLGVSTFFTLSGFLITRLLLDEHRASGRIDLRAFWGRRARRLLPAAIACLLLVAALEAAGTIATSAGDRGDWWSALLYGANWRFVFAGHSYADLFASPSPVQHFWSLAIEEQFYLLYPLVLLAGFTWFHTRRGRSPSPWPFVTAFALLAALVVVVGRATGNTDVLYYGSPFRFAEIAAGAALAAVLAGRGERRLPRGAAIAGIVGLAVSVWAFGALTQSTGQLYEGGLPLFALASVALIVGALARGPVRQLLSIRPLAAIGAISYGIYLFHWPVFLALTSQRVGRDGAALFALRLAVTIGLAVVSAWLIERPFRTGRVRLPRPRIALPAAMASLLAVGAIAIPNVAPSLAQDLSSHTKPASIGSLEPRAGLGPGVAFVGDSTAFRTVFGLDAWAQRTGVLHIVGTDTRFGCGLGRGGDRMYGRTPEPVPAECNEWATSWPTLLQSLQPDVAMVQFGPWDVVDHRLPGDSTWRAPGDPTYDAFLEGEMRTAMDVFHAAGVPLVWLTAPDIEIGRNEVPPPADPYPGSDPARTHRFNDLLREAAAGRADVRIVDLNGYLASLPGGEMDAHLRPDGVHFTEETSQQAIAPWLGPAVVDALQSIRGH